MKKISFLVFCFALISGLKAADVSGTVPPSYADTGAAPDPAQVELARQVIKSMHADRMFDQMSAQMQQMAAQSLNVGSGNMTPQQKALAAKVTSQVMTLSMESGKGLLSKMDVIYAEVYSESELKAMKAFFESPEGASMLKKQPQIMQKLMPYVQQMQKTLMPKIQKITQDAKAEEQAAAAVPTPTPTPTK